MAQQVSIVGLGYVGLPLALLTAKKGYPVMGIDLSEEKIRLINSGVDPLNDEYVKSHIKGTSLKASNSFDSISTSSIVIICVPTPVKHDYQPDLRPLKSAIKLIAPKLKPSAKTLVIVESTINPGVCNEIVIPYLEKHSGLKINHDFFVSHCPERINPGDKKWSVENIPRVAGSSHPKSLKRTTEFYGSIINAPVKPMGSIKEAEAVKVVENSFRDVNIAFVNELAVSFTKLGIDVKNVIDGASTKPFGFMAHYPSIGVGGHCIPVDPYYLIEYARGYGFEHEFLSLARSINNRMPEFTMEQLIDGLNEVGHTLKNSRILVLGISYKADVADDRESPSYEVIKLLKAKGAKVEVYDPYFPAMSNIKNLKKALKNNDGVVLATSHKEFLKIKPSDLGSKVFIDGKNSFTPKDFKAAGIVYRGIGR